MFELKHQKTKTLKLKPNGRSSDFVSPNFILGCNGGCSSYCYTNRFGRNKVYINDNIDDILSIIDKESKTWGIKIPNQTDEKYWTVDISCDSDIPYHWKDYNWEKVFNFFTTSSNLKATFATKYVNNQLLKYGNEQLRIRFSLMPQNISDILEKNTSNISIRIDAINRFIENGWDVHINYSPVVYYEGWEKDYKLLFEEVNDKVKYKNVVKAEVIFLTHNKSLRNTNLKLGKLEEEKLLWNPSIQEEKVSEYGGVNVRYEWRFKNELIKKFKELHNEKNSWCDIRYIF